VQGGLQFTLAGIPVKVEWFFFIVAALFGFGYSYDPTLFLGWVVIMFLAILFHEMGHAFMYRRFGVQPSIVIHGFGGLTYGRSLPVGRDLLVSLAGPFVGILIGLPLLYVRMNVPIRDDRVWALLGMGIFTNLAWAILNLLPLMPLDGGNATNSFLSLVLRRDMTRFTRVLSMITGSGLALLALQYRMLYPAFLAGYFVFMNYQALQQHTDVSRFSQHTTYKPPKPKKQSRSARRASRKEQAPPERDWTPPDRPPVEAWEPTPPRPPSPTSKISTVGWVQPGAKPDRTFAVELDTATQALSRRQPELAAIALDRARKKAVHPHEHAAADQLQAEINRHLNASD
jgi:Zn-dependent protease